MRSLLLASTLMLYACGMTPVFAQEADEHCVPVDKFVEQNSQAKVVWNKTLEPQQIKPVVEFLGVPEPEKITEVRLFTASLPNKPPDAGVAFGHDGIICLWAILPPQAVPVIKHLLEATKGTEI